MKFKLKTKAKIEDTDSDDLIITGVASDTSIDRYKEYVTPEALKSLCEQAKNLNLHYNHKPSEVIGVIIDSKIIKNQLIIKAKILPAYAEELKSKLEFGVNYGLSIAGIPNMKKDGAIIDYDLIEISLTEEPANANTYATVEIDDTKTFTASCLGGMCHIINKEMKNMSKDTKKVEETKEEETKFVTVDDLNNALNEFKGAIITDVSDGIEEKIIEAVLEKINASKKEEESAKDITEIVDKAVKNGLEEFGAKYFKHQDENRNPEKHAKFQKNLNTEEETVQDNKMTVKQIAKLI